MQRYGFFNDKYIYAYNSNFSEIVVHPTVKQRVIYGRIVQPTPGEYYWEFVDDRDRIFLAYPPFITRDASSAHFSLFCFFNCIPFPDPRPIHDMRYIAPEIDVKS